MNEMKLKKNRKTGEQKPKQNLIVKVAKSSSLSVSHSNITSADIGLLPHSGGVDVIG